MKTTEITNEKVARMLGYTHYHENLWVTPGSAGLTETISAAPLPDFLGDSEALRREVGRLSQEHINCVIKELWFPARYKPSHEAVCAMLTLPHAALLHAVVRALEHRIHD